MSVKSHGNIVKRHVCFGASSVKRHVYIGIISFGMLFLGSQDEKACHTENEFQQD